jgi:hypothetical protein
MQSNIRKSDPMYWTVLSDEDQTKYRQLQRSIDPLLLRTTRHQLPAKFQIMIHQIQQYVVQHNDDDWKRNLVCGIIWLDDAIAICTKQLSKLMKKCKSSINFGFQSLGYVTVTMTSEHASVLMQTLPVFACGSGEIRQWTVRAKQMNWFEKGNCEKKYGIDCRVDCGINCGMGCGVERISESHEMMETIESLSGMNGTDEFMFRDDGNDSTEFQFHDFDFSI